MQEGEVVDAEFSPQNESDPHLPGMEPVIVPEIAAKARKYAAARDTRIKFLAEEIRLKEELSVLMHTHELSRYEEDDLLVTLKTTEKIKVKIDSEEDEEGEAE
jgi:hypothetical protein